MYGGGHVAETNTVLDYSVHAFSFGIFVQSTATHDVIADVQSSHRGAEIQFPATPHR